MKKTLMAFAAAALVASFAWAQGHIYISTTQFKDYVYYSLLADVPTGQFPGQLRVINVDGGQPYLQIFDAVEGGSDRFILDDVADTFEAAMTFTGAATFNGSVTVGDNEDDNATFNAPAQFNVRRTEFDFVGFYGEPFLGDDMTVDVIDNAQNLFHFPGSQIPLIFMKFEQAFGGTFAPEVFLTGGTDADGEGTVFLIDSASLLDVVDNDAVDFALFGDPDDTATWDESSGLDAYCEITIRIDDISDISANDFYFGWFLNAAFQGAFGYESSNTYAAFGVLDTAGDLVIQTDLNGAGVAEDDSGITIADNGDYVLRVEMSADAVAFYIDGTAVTQTNAVLNADDGDTFYCGFGIRSAGTSAATIELETIEVGLEQ